MSVLPFNSAVSFCPPTFYRKNACSSSTRVIFATPIAFTQLGDPGWSLLLAPCVLAPQTMNDGEEPPVQQTSASLLFQSHADTLPDLCRTICKHYTIQNPGGCMAQSSLCHKIVLSPYMTGKSFLVASFANPAYGLTAPSPGPGAPPLPVGLTMTVQFHGSLAPAPPSAKPNVGCTPCPFDCGFM